MNDTEHYLAQGLAHVREASRELARCTDETVRTVLYALAEKALANHEEILEANRSDLARMPEDDPKYDRLLLNPDRLQAICSDLRSVADLPSPVGEELEEKTLDNGLQLSKVRVPMGVIAVIFESRPNVTFDVFALCLKTRNACVLKGSSDAHDTNRVVVRCGTTPWSGAWPKVLPNMVCTSTSRPKPPPFTPKAARSPAWKRPAAGSIPSGCW